MTTFCTLTPFLFGHFVPTLTVAENAGATCDAMTGLATGELVKDANGEGRRLRRATIAFGGWPQRSRSRNGMTERGRHGILARTGATPLLAALVTAAVTPALAQEPSAGAARPWRFAAYVDAYFDPGESTFLVPTVFADRGRLHLEARYNYEDFDTGSLFAGRTFAFEGENDYLKLTPMVGAFVGNSNGVAPGLEVEARWRRLAYWLEAEYTFNHEDPAANYFYTWSEADLYLTRSLWVGGSVQRLRLVETPQEVDVGPMIGFGRTSAPGASLSLYFYGIGSSTPWYLATVAVQF